MKDITKIINQPEIFRIRIPLKSSALKNRNVYVIRSQEQVLVIDTGLRTEECRKHLVEGLSELGVDISRANLFLTHTHTDQKGLAGLFTGEKTAFTWVNQSSNTMLMSTQEAIGNGRMNAI